MDIADRVMVDALCDVCREEIVTIAFRRAYDPELVICWKCEEAFDVPE